jgi:hypothetical protein
MFKLDDNLLRELGLGSLPADEKNKMLAHIYETLEMRVGMKLAEKMTNEQLDEFEGFIDRNDEAGALKWLETNFPNYKQVVADELEALKVEIRQAAPQILAASPPAQHPQQQFQGQAGMVNQQVPAAGYQQMPQPAPAGQAPVYQQPAPPAMQPQFADNPGGHQPPQGVGYPQPPMVPPTDNNVAQFPQQQPAQQQDDDEDNPAPQQAAA